MYQIDPCQKLYSKIEELVRTVLPLDSGKCQKKGEAGCLELVGRLVEQCQRLIRLEQNYEMLEENLQKTESDIRKHIRLEQQLKLHMDGLEEENERLEKKLHELIQGQRSPPYRFKRSTETRDRKSKNSLDPKRSVNSRTEHDQYLHVRQHIAVQKRKGSQGVYRSTMENKNNKNVNNLSDIKLRVELVSKLAKGKQLSSGEKESLLGRSKSRRY